jgi:hypothetical protein
MEKCRISRFLKKNCMSPFRFFLRTTKIIFFLISFSVFSQKTDWKKISYQKIDTQRLDSVNKRMSFLMDSILSADTILAALKRAGNADLQASVVNGSQYALFSIGENGKFSPESVAMCYCSQKNDTVFIQLFFGFMAGGSLNMRIHKNKFTSAYFEYADDAKIYSVNKNDTALTKEIEVKNEMQKLIISENDAAQKEICGTVETTSAVFYQMEYDPVQKEQILKSRSVSIKAIFKCRPLKL